jgi:hypothetical protein
MGRSWEEEMRSYWWEQIKYLAERWFWYWPTIWGLTKSRYAVRWPFEEYYGKTPSPEDYRPSWPKKERTAYQLYETVSEGTPISPVFETIEALVDWCVEQNDSETTEVWVGTHGMEREEWVRFFSKGGWALSAMWTAEHGLEAGVKAIAREEE